MSKKSTSHAVHGHDDHGHDDHAHGSFKSYMTGFVLSVILTAIPFWLVMGEVIPSRIATALVIMAFAMAQMVVHMIYFLHMHPKSEGGWNMMALFFTIIVVVIAMSGSMWVMFHLNANMMPVHDMDNMEQQATEPTSTEAVSPTVPVTPQNIQLP